MSKTKVGNGILNFVKNVFLACYVVLLKIISVILFLDA